MGRADPEAIAYLRAEHAGALELAAWTRDAVLAADPDLSERVYHGWRGVGYRHPEAGYVCGLFPRGERVELVFERGATLLDPEAVLAGSGTQTRVLSVTAASDGLARTITAYVGQAIAQRLFL